MSGGFWSPCQSKADQAQSKVQSSIVARRWTPADEALPAQLLEEGKDLSAIALRMKRTIAAVQRRASDLRARSAFRDSKPER